MMLYALLPPQWLRDKDPTCRPLQINDDFDRVQALNNQGYNAYYYPNYPSIIQDDAKFILGSEIDTFEWVFVDFDLKSGAYSDKDAFIARLGELPFIPTAVVDSGGGIHAYWKVSDLTAESYLRLQRRLARLLNTDIAVVQIKQLMRVPGTFNTKVPEAFKACEEIFYEEIVYTCEQLDKFLPKINLEDEEYCKQHFNKTYEVNQENHCIDDKIPLKFAHLLKNSPEAKEIWAGSVEDRSKGDYRLGHIMFANGFTTDEAISVLVNSAKALARAPIHRLSYARNIIDKIWTFEIAQDKETLGLSSTVREILERHGDTIKGERFPCYTWLDNTVHGFRLGQVIGLVAGSGVGKTAFALNMFQGFVKNNPDYEHFFIPLEQPANEIADRWRTMCGENTNLHNKVHVMSNYDDNGGYRNLSFEEIKNYLLKFQQVTGKKIGCVVIDHIGALKKSSKEGRQSVEDICHQMKGFAVETNTLLIMQSQAPREKAGIGDLELNKDAAYGTVFFESYCDYLLTLWQPLKRSYTEEGCPTVTAFKFCKIRHKKQGQDVVKEDTPYLVGFDTHTEQMHDMTQQEQTAFDFFARKCLNKRKQDRKTDLVEYTTIRQEPHGTTDQDSPDVVRTPRAG